MKCWSTCANKALFIHPEGAANPSDPSGEPFRNSAWYFFLGNTSTGGNATPVADMMPHNVTSSPLSLDVICATPPLS